MWNHIWCPCGAWWVMRAQASCARDRYSEIANSTAYLLDQGAGVEEEWSLKYKKIDGSIVGQSINAGLRDFTPTEKFSRIWDPKYHQLLKGPADSQLKGYNGRVKDQSGYVVSNEDGANDTVRLRFDCVFQRDHVCELRFLSIIFMRHAADEAGENIKFNKSAFIWLAEVASDTANCVWLPQGLHNDKTQYFSGCQYRILPPQQLRLSDGKFADQPLEEEVRQYLVACSASFANMVMANYNSFYLDAAYGNEAKQMVKSIAKDILASPFCQSDWLVTGTKWRAN
ncbi:hypothetical protein B0H19DRAFT_1065366 [Mycena capillaripes]|nr:hypothetical protein B0H19DRAFT_1065366 [Mycena capillaripes]